MRRLQRHVTILALGAVLGLGCADAITLTASNFDVDPSPAFPGDEVEVHFVLTLLPTQSHTMVVFFGNTEHMRVTSDQRPPVPVRLDLGDAADLIDQHGTGNHAIYVEIHASDRAITTPPRNLELRQSPR